jgi:hypothetical protein
MYTKGEGELLHFALLEIPLCLLMVKQWKGDRGVTFYLIVYQPARIISS